MQSCRTAIPAHSSLRASPHHTVQLPYPYSHRHLGYKILSIPAYITSDPCKKQTPMLTVTEQRTAALQSPLEKRSAPHSASQGHSLHEGAGAEAHDATRRPGPQQQLGHQLSPRILHHPEPTPRHGPAVFLPPELPPAPGPPRAPRRAGLGWLRPPSEGAAVPAGPSLCGGERGAGPLRRCRNGDGPAWREVVVAARGLLAGLAVLPNGSTGSAWKRHKGGAGEGLGKGENSDNGSGTERHLHPRKAAVVTELHSWGG